MLMSTSAVKGLIYSNFLTKSLLGWLGVRILASFGPLAVTYIFSKAIEAIELGHSFNVVLEFFLWLLFIEVAEHLLRLSSKSMLGYYGEIALIKIQQQGVELLHPSSKVRNELVQALRNLTQALRRFVMFSYNNGIQGLVSFASVPILLFFIDKRVFVVQVVLIVLYLIFNVYISKIYEQKFEKYDESREYYFSALLANKGTVKPANYVFKYFARVQKVFFINWFSVQNLVTLFIFIVTYIALKDLFVGTKNISDLILIVGYMKESKMFLNNITGLLARLMEIDAGVERLVKIADDEGLVISS